MKLNIISILLVSLLTYSCSYNKKIDKEQEDTFKIEDQAQKDRQAKDNYEIVLDEKQAEKINEETQAAQPIIKDQVVEIQDRVFFGYDSALITDKAKEILNLQAQSLNNNPHIKITISILININPR